MSAGSASASELPAASVALIYRFVARLLAREVDTETAQALVQPDVLAIFERCDPGVKASVSPWDDTRSDAAAEAFAACFVLPDGVPPRACAWLGDGSDDKQTAFTGAVANQLQRYGLRRGDADRVGRLPLDHMALLLEVAAVGLQTGDPRSDRWIDAHLGTWAGTFGDALATRTTHPVYRALGVLVAQLFPRPSS